MADRDGPDTTPKAIGQSHRALFDRIAQRAMDAPEPDPADVAAAATRQLQQVRTERLQRARPAILLEDTLAIVQGRLQATQALGAVQRWRHARGGARPLQTLVLLGQTGRGKTVAGAWLLAEEGGRYVTADDMRRHVASSHWRERDWFEAFCNSLAVVVDDVGTESDADSARAAMFEVLNRRLSAPRALTLITGNITAAEFRDRYDDRTIRRIEHTGLILEVGGPDLRRAPPRPLALVPAKDDDEP